MKKLLLVLAILSLSGIAFGAGIPQVTDPQNSPEVWTQEVYTASALTVGMVVVWDFANVTTPARYTNRAMKVALTSTADDIRVAGVVLDSVVDAGNIATIAVKGPVYARTMMVTDTITAVSTAVGTASGATVGLNMGRVGGYTIAANSGCLGWAVTTTDNTVANGGYATTAATDSTMTVIFVNPISQ